MKKLFFLLVLALLSSNLFAYDFVANGFFYNKLEDGSVEITCYQTSDLLPRPVYVGDITIPSMVEYEGTTYQVTGIGAGAFSLCEGLTSVVIGNNITYIGSGAFSSCTKLATINIPNSVVSIGDKAFYSCSGLTSISIGNGVTSIGENALYMTLNNLESITVAEGNPKYIGQGNCLIEKATKTLILGCKNSIIPTDESVTSIGTQAFANCGNLTEMTIPNNITSIDSDAFANCTGITAIDFGSGLTSISTYAFYNCTSLTEITIPRNVTDISQGAFTGCSGLTSIKAAGRHPVYRSTDNCLYNL